ncbi:MAG TPA: SPFH domain-containing protein [Myxococcaceae bacterium]|nr:SPFH domain-containing protein [Myxococcaceae bacterium]
MRPRPLLAFCLAALPVSGCACHSTGSTEVGVLTKKVALGGLYGKPGVQPEIYAPGANYFFPAFLTDWNTFDVSLQNLAMVKDSTRGDRSGEDDLSFKTVDGNDVRVDVTVAWQVDPQRAPYLLNRVGDNVAEVKEKLVRPACRSVVRDVLNELRSEEFYVSEKRFAKAAEARDRLQAVLGPEGVVVRQVILGEHRFNPDYEKVIRDKKLAEQNSERMRSEARAAAEQWKSELEKAKGTVNQQLAAAAGALDTARLGADASYVQSQKQAEAIVAERKAHAEAVRKQNEALAGSGGKALVKLRIAEALAGKQIVFLPTGKSGVGVQTLNLNQLLGALSAGGEAAAPSQAPPPSP